MPYDFLVIKYIYFFLCNSLGVDTKIKPTELTADASYKIEK